jgi:hypothetical protein
MSNPPPTSECEVLPSLDPVTVADDELLGMAVDAVVVGDREARERMEEILRYTEALQAIVDTDTWQLFLTYDERVNARFAELLLVVARAAFGDGRRHPFHRGRLQVRRWWGKWWGGPGDEQASPTYYAELAHFLGLFCRHEWVRTTGPYRVKATRRGGRRSYP